MPIKKVFKDKAPVKVWTDDIDEASAKQLLKMASMPFIHKHIAVMPDVHLGHGATIGSVIPTKGAVIPAGVGVDIGCGMMAVQLSLKASDLPENLKSIRTDIERAVPHGFASVPGRSKKGRFILLSSSNISRWNAISSGYDWILEKHPKVVKEMVMKQLGTLGGGNHFIELCLDEVGCVWVMLHSGSRGVGNNIGRYFINLAKKDMKRHFINLPDMDLAYLTEGTEYFNDYVEAVGWAQTYASENRLAMMDSVLRVLRTHLRPFEFKKKVINCHHNYISREHHYGENVLVTRKGAIRARKGDLGIIPGSMGASSFIIEGKGNEESFNSCSHGAGRTMSRTQARKLFTVEDLERETRGIECPKDKARIDEIPSSYKSIETVMENQSDLVHVLHTLKQVLNVKG